MLSGNFEGKYQYYNCSFYRFGKHFQNICTRHGIRRDVIENIALTKIREIVSFARDNKEEFASRIQKMASADSEKALKSKTSELVKSEHRFTELDQIVKRVYEDNVTGKLSDELFAKFISGYEAERSELTVRISALKAELEEIQGKAANLQGFMNIAGRYAHIPELTAEVARMFIEKIVVHEATYKRHPKKKRGEARSQEVQIIFNCIGEFNPV